MKVIILMSSWGIRLGRLSESIPQPMVSIGGKPAYNGIHHLLLYDHSYNQRWVLILILLRNLIFLLI